MLKEIRKYFYISYLFLKNSLIGQMEYRFNFFMIILLDLLYVAVRIIFMSVIYKTNINVNGMTPDSILLHVGIFTIISGFFGLLFSDNFFRISDYIRNGTLDSFLIKPISCQFLVSLRNFNVGLAIPDLFIGSVMMVMACNKLNILIALPNLLGLSALMLSSLMVLYSIFLLPHILCFWITKGAAIISISNVLFEFNIMPMGIYNKTIQQIGIFLIPIFIIPNFPTLFLLNKMSVVYYTWAIIAPFVLFWIARKFWNFGLKNYSSCSS